MKRKHKLRLSCHFLEFFHDIRVQVKVLWEKKLLMKTTPVKGAKAEMKNTSQDSLGFAKDSSP